MYSKTTVVHILGLLAWLVHISSEVSARVFTETSSNTQKDVENINENKVSYGDYGGFGGVYPGNRNYLNNGRGYYGGYPNGGFYPNNGYLINGGGYGGGYPINGGSNVGNGGYGLGYPGNTGGFNGNDFIRTIGDIIGGIVGNIGGGLNGGRRGAAVAVQTKDNTHN
ncbi:unnamed protein product [Vicia faba]|uniref:Glycine-rich protein n=1 Tax=Vicia faba TaxID=3906 RepID=A0AAV0YKA8_VICFA|nr:unnamed protein product [Vicia faba]